jgi:hypothetical protein
MGTGSMLVRVATTLFWVEAEEVCVVAAAPVRTRIATKARTMFFMDVALFEPFKMDKLLKISTIRLARPEVSGLEPCHRH